MKCPKCGNQAQDDALFCDQCGQRLTPAPSVTPSPAASPAPAQPGAQGLACPSCGTRATPGEMFCDECGAPLEAPQPDVAVEAVPVAQPAPTTPQPAAAAPEPAPQTVCPACGAGVTPGDAFCFACGAQLLRPSAAPVAAAVPPAQPEPEVQPQEAAASPAPTAGECPACGAKVGPGDAFCEFCGAALVGMAPRGAVGAQAQAAPTPAAPVSPAAPAMARARLVLADSGVELPVQEGKETLVGREDPFSGIFPDIDLTPYGAEEAGVSRRHFRIAAAAGQYTIEDLNSTNLTLLNQNKLDPGKKAPLKDGDAIRAGRLKLVFRVG